MQEFPYIVEAGIGSDGGFTLGNGSTSRAIKTEVQFRSSKDPELVDPLLEAGVLPSVNHLGLC